MSANETNPVPEDTKDIECPVCLILMVPPIRQCENGHGTCYTCREELKECPVCKGKLTDKRQYEAENLSRKLKYACRFHTSGCTEKCFLVLKEKHESQCPYRYHKCPLCYEKLSPPDIKGHILNDHKEKLKQVPLNTPQLFPCHFSQKPTDYIYDQDPIRHNLFQEAWVAEDEVFIVCLVKTTDDHRYNWAKYELKYVYCAYVGSAEEARKYKYKITFYSPNMFRFMTTSFSTQCLSYLETVDVGINDDICVQIPPEIVRKCNDLGSKITLEIEISKM